MSQHVQLYFYSVSVSPPKCPPPPPRHGPGPSHIFPWTPRPTAQAPCEKDLRASFEQSSEKATVLALQAGNSFPSTSRSPVVPFAFGQKKKRGEHKSKNVTCGRNWGLCFLGSPLKGGTKLSPGAKKGSYSWHPSP